MATIIKVCPFCQSDDIRYSVKKTTIKFEPAYHAAMYCNHCHCYGPRILHKGKREKSRYDFECEDVLKKCALDAWNFRPTD